MKKFLLLLPILAFVALPANAQTPKKKASFLKRAGSQLLHAPEAVIYEGVLYVGAGVDVVERAVAAVHTAVSKVDDVLDRAEQAINPTAATQTQAPAVHPPATSTP